MAFGLDQTISDKKNDNAIDIDEIFSNLLVAAPENRQTIANHLEKGIIERVNKASNEEAMLALELAISFNSILNFYFAARRFTTQTDGLTNFWASVSSRILIGCTTRSEDLCKQSLILTMALYNERKEELITKLIEWHGVSSIFRPGLYTLRPHSRRISLFDQITRQLTRTYLNDEKKQTPIIQKNIELLKELGDKLLSCPPPWVPNATLIDFPKPNLHDFPFDDRVRKQLNDDKSLHFGVFILYAILWEYDETLRKEIDKSEAVKILSNTKEFIPSNISYLLQARKGPFKESVIRTLISNSGFTNIQEELVWRWVHQKVNLTYVRS